MAGGSPSSANSTASTVLVVTASTSQTRSISSSVSCQRVFAVAPSARSAARGRDRPHRGAKEPRLVASRAAKQQARVPRFGLREHLVRRIRDGQELRVCAAVRTHTRDRLRQIEAVVGIYIKCQGWAFLFSVGPSSP